MKRTNKTGVWFRRLWALVLAAGLVCTLMGTVSAAPILDAVSVPDVSSPKPTVVIQGNVVVDKNKPTGFYELALCVKTARTITDKATNDPVTEEQYAQVLADDEKNGTTHAVDDYDIVNYPFQSAASTVRVDLDALTAVTWGSGKPVYSTWTQNHGTAGVYAAEDANYPRGIDMTDPDNLENAALFTSLKEIIDAEAANGNQDKVRVRLDTAKPDEVTNATALIEGYDAATHTALLTLTANSTTTANVVYNTPTPVVVVRFAYDLNRFKNTVVGDPNDPVTAPNTSDFWAGLDRNDSAEVTNGKSPLTCLAAGDQTPGADLYGDSDREAAEASIHQAVWYEHNMESDQVAQRSTQFYYYLGAENKSHETDTQNIQVLEDDGTGKRVLKDYSLVMPHTAGKVVLADKNAEYATPGDPETAKYSFFQNLLTMGDKTLRVELVNAETYRKPTGGGGINILFYDWDDSLIGSLIVDGGDVRSQVEEYVEENLVHPDLRPDKVLSQMGGKLPDYSTTTPAAGSPAETYQNLTNSLARDYTYRGKYAYTVGDPDTVGADGDTANKARANGEDYPLTNKLDYVFTKRVNTAVTRTVTTGLSQYDETYVLPYKLTGEGMEDAALYPYAYGWAVVEDTSAKNQAGWKVMYDAKKIEDTWTTVGVGELSNVDPDYYDSGSATPKTVSAPAAGSSVVAGSTAYTAPAFLADADPDWTDNTGGTNPKNPNNEYAYQLNSSGSEGYFRFADFSDIDAELAQYQTQSGERKNTLIVKAVYEPGESLLDRGSYEMIQRPYYNKLNNVSASGGAAYSVQVTLERQNSTQGQVQGVSRVRVPVIRQDNTIDQKWIESEFPEVSHDLINATIAEARSGEQSTYTKVDIDNGEEIQFSLSVSARQNKVNYVLVEQYNDNFVTGGQRSEQNYNRLGLEFAIDNYNYQTKESVDGDGYYDSDYETRNGSHGFVLYGTLNQLMQYATLNHTEGTDVTLIISRTNMMDANLRANLKGDEPSVLNQADMRQAILNAAIACEAHKGDPDFWNSELNCAELSYHQLQWYIIDGSLDTRAVADGKKLDFCHLHEECAAAMSTIPDTWDEIITAARANNTADLSKMTTTAIENLTYLRTDANGRPFDSANNFTTAIIDAVTKLDALHAGETDYKPSWWELQYVFLNGNTASVDDMRSEASGKYWWYDGSTTAPALPTTASEQWPALLQAARDVYIPYNATLKDGVTNDWTTTTHLATAKTAFDRNAATSAASHPAWQTLTGNLVLDHHEDPILDDDDNPTGELNYTTDKFPSFEDFQTRLVDAMKLLDASGTGGSQSPTWRELQLAILQVDDPTDDAGAATGDEYWWYNGAKPFKITNLRTLIEAVRRMALDDAGDIVTYTPEEVQAARDAWGKLTVADLEGSLTNTLRWSKTGQDASEVWAGQNEANQKQRIYNLLNAARVDMEAASATIDWTTIQYHIINKKVDDEATTLQQARYYWWKDGGEGVEMDFSGATDVTTKLQTVIQATFRTDFGDPKAKQSVADQATNNDFWELTHLVTAIVNETDPNANPDDHYVGPDTAAFARQSAYKDTDLDDFLDMIVDFRQAAQTDQSLGEYDMPLFSWYQIQYYVLENTYVPLGNAILFPLEDPQTGYWWYDRDARDIPEPEPELPNPAQGMKDEILNILDGSTDPEDFKASLTPEMFANWGIVCFDGSPIRDDQLEPIGYAIDELPQALQDNGVNAADLGWAQLQLIVATYADEWWLDLRPTEEEALIALVQERGATTISNGGFIPDEYVDIFPDVFEGMFSLRSMVAQPVEPQYYVCMVLPTVLLTTIRRTGI